MNRRVPASIAMLAIVLTAAVAVLLTLVGTGTFPGAGTDPDMGAAADTQNDPDYLFTQAFTSGTLTGSSDSDLTLTLTGLRKYLTAFTDRPERQANLLDNGDFYRMWDSWFEADPPNAVLSYTPAGLDRPVGVVVKLMNPRYFPESGTVTYQAVKIPKSEALLAGAEVEVVPAPNDPNVQNHIESFGPGMLFIDDATALKTSFTGFFNSPTTPSVNDTLSNVTLTPSITLGTVTVTGNTNGTLTGTLTASLGASGATPIQTTGSFTWTDSNDWTVTLDSASGEATTVSGTITDTAGAITSALTVNTTVGDQNTPVELDLTYDGVGNFAGHGSTGDFTIKNSTFSNVTASFTTANPSLSITGTMTTTSAGSTNSSEYDFSGTVDAAGYSIDISGKLPTGESGEVTLTGTSGGDLSGSLDLTDAVIGGMSYPTLKLSFDTSHAEVAASGTVVTNLGTLNAGFNIYEDALTNINISNVSPLEFGSGLTIESIQFSAATGTAADPNCTTGGKTSYSGNSSGSMRIGQNSASFSNALSISCGQFDSEEFEVTLSHKTGSLTRSLVGIIYFSAEGGTVNPCPVTTNPVNNGCGTTVPYLTSPITSSGPFFYGSLSYAPSVSHTFTYTIAGVKKSDTANIGGSIGMGVMVYSDSSGDWQESIGLGGEVSVYVRIVYSVTYSGTANAGAVCTFNTSGDDFACNVAFDARISGRVAGKTYAYHYYYSDSTSF